MLHFPNNFCWIPTASVDYTASSGFVSPYPTFLKPDRGSYQYQHSFWSSPFVLRAVHFFLHCCSLPKSKGLSLTFRWIIPCYSCVSGRIYQYLMNKLGFYTISYMYCFFSNHLLQHIISLPGRAGLLVI